MKEEKKSVFTTQHVQLVWQSATEPEVRITHKWYFKSPCWVLVAIRYGNMEFRVCPETDYVWVEKANTPTAEELKSALSSEEVRKEIDTVLAYEGFPTLDSCVIPVKNEGQLLPEWTDKAYFGSITIWPQYRFNLGCGSGFVHICRLVTKV